MFGIGTGELLLILLVILIIFGPKRLPELARTISRSIYELRHMWTQAKQAVEREVKDDG